MAKKIFFILPFLLFSSVFLFAQKKTLAQDIQTILKTKKAFVGVCILDENGKKLVSIHANNKFPIQSVFKFHLALAVMDAVEKNKFKLSDSIIFSEKDMKTDLFSPIKNKYPKGCKMIISDILRYTVSESDNIGCDFLIEKIGGISNFDDFFKKNGYKGISFKYNENIQQQKWQNQFENWITPQTSSQILFDFYHKNRFNLSNKNKKTLLDFMENSPTGLHRLKAGLTKNTVLMHKTGTSGTDENGITAAVNDIGIILLPNKKPIFISVFVSKSSESINTNEKIIAEIANATWKYFEK